MLLKKDKAQALLELLSIAHADDYMGTDDMMIDSCNDWIADLTDEEICEIVLNIYHAGI
jgi:hypothetical protein